MSGDAFHKSTSFEQLENQFEDLILFFSLLGSSGDKILRNWKCRYLGVKENEINRSNTK